MANAFFRNRNLLGAVLTMLSLSPAYAGLPPVQGGLDTTSGVKTLPLSILGKTVMQLDTLPTGVSQVTVDGSMYLTTGNGYYHLSDENLKENVQGLDGLTIINQLNGVSFTWKQSHAPSVGVIAQDVEKVLPTAVLIQQDGYKTVDYDQLIAPLIEAVKQLKADNDELRDEVQTLRAEVHQ